MNQNQLFTCIITHTHQLQNILLKNKDIFWEIFSTRNFEIYLEISSLTGQFIYKILSLKLQF